jgi:hypothetical protein
MCLSNCYLKTVLSEFLSRNRVVARRRDFPNILCSSYRAFYYVVLSFTSLLFGENEFVFLLNDRYEHY